MKWNRAELKGKGKMAFKANAIMCIVAALLLLVAGGTSSGSPVSVSYNFGRNDVSLKIFNYDLNDLKGDDYFIDNGDLDNDYDDHDWNDERDDHNDDWDDDHFDEDIHDHDGSFDDTYEETGFHQTNSVLGTAILGGIAMSIVFAILAFAVVINAFLLNPLHVGLRKFFIDNSSDERAGLNRNNIGLAFRSGYMNIVGAMFTTGLFTFLWSLLLIIPGVIKSYEWRMVPYLLAENPELTGADARQKSSEMMNGSKMDAFVLDLSFIGWYLLGAITLGIANLVWSNPYKAATDAELYLALDKQMETEQQHFEI